MDATVRQMKSGAQSSGETFSLVPVKFLHLLGAVDILRAEACCRLEQNGRAEKGQFLTPAPVAQLMASLLVGADQMVSLLDAGAGVGSLFAAAVAALCERPDRPKRIHVVAYESPSGQNVLVERIIAEFAPIFTPGGKLLYVGDTDEKFAYFDQGRPGGAGSRG